MVKRIRVAKTPPDPNDPTPPEVRRRANRLLRAAQIGLVVALAGAVLLFLGTFSAFPTTILGIVLLLVCALAGAVIVSLTGPEDHFNKARSWARALIFGPLFTLLVWLISLGTLIGLILLFLT